jgi:hypothetical protein
VTTFPISLRLSWQSSRLPTDYVSMARSRTVPMTHSTLSAAERVWFPFRADWRNGIEI